MHPYFFSHLYRARLAEFEREAEIRRHLAKHERGGLKRLASAITRTRRRPQVAAEAQPCL